MALNSSKSSNFKQLELKRLMFVGRVGLSSKCAMYFDANCLSRRPRIGTYCGKIACGVVKKNGKMEKGDRVQKE